MTILFNLLFFKKDSKIKCIPCLAKEFVQPFFVHFRFKIEVNFKIKSFQKYYFLKKDKYLCIISMKQLNDFYNYKLYKKIIIEKVKQLYYVNHINSWLNSNDNVFYFS